MNYRENHQRASSCPTHRKERHGLVSQAAATSVDLRRASQAAVMYSKAVCSRREMNELAIKRAHSAYSNYPSLTDHYQIQTKHNEDLLPPSKKLKRATDIQEDARGGALANVRATGDQSYQIEMS